MKVFMIILSVVFASASIFLLAKFGAKRKESAEYINADKNLDN